MSAATDGTARMLAWAVAWTIACILTILASGAVVYLGGVP
jgi:hypothetical protein